MRLKIAKIEARFNDDVAMEPTSETSEDRTSAIRKSIAALLLVVGSFLFLTLVVIDYVNIIQRFSSPGLSNFLIALIEGMLRILVALSLIGLILLSTRSSSSDVVKQARVSREELYQVVFALGINLIKLSTTHY